MSLRALVAVEIVAQLVAPRDDAEQLLLGRQVAALRRIKILNRPPQFSKVCAYAAGFVHLADWAIEKAVGLPCRFHDFLAAHIGQLVDALAEFRAVHILRQQVSDIALHLFGKLAFHLIFHRHQPDSLLGRNGRHRIGRGQFQLRFGSGECFGRCIGRHGGRSSSSGDIME